MGKNQRIRKELREDKKILEREEIKKRGKEKFWGQANPIIRFSLTILATILLLWAGS